MTKKLLRPIGFRLLSLCVMAWAAALGATQDGTARILYPSEGMIVESDSGIPVEVVVKGLTSGKGRNFHYWVSLGESNNGRVGRLHWPRFHITEELDRETISSQVPQLGEKSDAMLLILRVDDATNLQFEEWLERCTLAGSSPGLQLKPDQIIAKVVIYLADS